MLFWDSLIKGAEQVEDHLIKMWVVWEYKQTGYQEIIGNVLKCKMQLSAKAE